MPVNDYITIRKIRPLFSAEFYAADSVGSDSALLRAQDKNPFLPHLTACMYATMQVHEFPFLNGRAKRGPQTIWRHHGSSVINTGSGQRIGIARVIKSAGTQPNI